MKIPKEHKLAFKISILLLFLAVLISYFVVSNNHNPLWYWRGNEDFFWNNNRFIVFFILSICIYFISYFLARITIKPIEEHNKKLKDYNHNLAHELKTPISIVKSNLELLEIEYDKNLIKSSQEELDFMINIIDSLLFLSNKNKKIIKQKINIIEIFNKNIKKYHIKPLFKISSKSILLEINEELFNLLVKNLIENAIKYWKDSEKIEINLTNKFFTIKNKVNQKIDEKNLDILFETFYQADNSRGNIWYWLWLSIVKKIIELHKFEIKLQYIDDFFIVKVIY